MEFEAWQFIRLFFDDDAIRFADAKPDAEDFTPGFLLTVKVEENNTEWICTASFFNELKSYESFQQAWNHETAPLYSSCRKVSHEELRRPGGSLFKSRKIVVGSCICDILSQFTGKDLPYGALIGVRPVKLAMQCINDGLDKAGTVKQLMKVTGMNESKAALLHDVAAVEKPYLNADPKTLHLYIGIPFCASRCLYCSFTAYPIAKYQALVPDYLKALEKEMEYVSQWVHKNSYTIGSVYIGGGTPTAIDEKALAMLIDALQSSFDIAGKEFTIEAGRPDTISREKLEVMYSRHVSRISINPQTMNQKTLRLIGRNHTPEDIENKFRLARLVGFDNINMDIIAGLPEEDEEMFRNTLEQIENMAPDSLTVHTMALKRASRLHEDLTSYQPSADKIVETMIEEARNLASKMGMRPYYLYRQKNILANLENTGYAKPGYECLYNIHTMEEEQTIIAMGAGASSKFVFPHQKRLERVFKKEAV